MNPIFLHFRAIFYKTIITFLHYTAQEWITIGDYNQKTPFNWHLPPVSIDKNVNDKCQCKLFLLPLDGSVCASNLSLFVGNSPFVSVHPHIQRHWHLHPPRATLSVVALLLVYRIITVGNCRKGRLHSPQLDFCWVAWVEVQLIPNRIHVLLQRGRGVG